MLKFVNAKINIGLNIVRRRRDGYHDLETVFYPVGMVSGTPQSPGAFDDILEITVSDKDMLHLSGRKVACAQEKNLVWRALGAYRDALAAAGMPDALPQVAMTLEKHLPDGAGMGGGSADATFTLRMLNELAGNPFADDILASLALRLGADCPFFLINAPAFASGVGECLSPLPLSLAGKWLVVAKPEISISTAEAFACVTPREPSFDLRDISSLPLSSWPEFVHNDFEDSLFPRWPELAAIKRSLYRHGASYASLTGSGSALYGIFSGQESAAGAASAIESTDTSVWLLLLT